MARQKIENLQSFLENKKENHSVRITTIIKGELKNKFLSDCINKNEPESNVASNLLEIYYVLVDKFPEMSRMDYVEIKKYINEKIRL